MPQVLGALVAHCSQLSALWGTPQVQRITFLKITARQDGPHPVKDPVTDKAKLFQPIQSTPMDLSVPGLIVQSAEILPLSSTTPSTQSYIISFSSTGADSRDLSQ